MQNTQEIQFNIELWKEGNMYVAYVPQLDISSCGYTTAEARKNIKEATELFIEEIENMGTSQEVLEEAGFYFYKQAWKAPKLSLEKIQLAF